MNPISEEPTVGRMVNLYSASYLHGPKVATYRGDGKYTYAGNGQPVQIYSDTSWTYFARPENEDATTDGGWVNCSDTPPPEKGPYEFRQSATYPYGPQWRNLTTDKLKERLSVENADEHTMKIDLYTLIENEPPTLSFRRALLEEAANVIDGKREETYGGPEDSFRKIAAFWSAYLGDRPLEPHDVAAMMALLKIARIAGSNGSHRDSWVDLAGYAGCGAECAPK